MINPVPVQVNSNLLETHSSEGHLEKLGLSINIKAWLKFYHRHITAMDNVLAITQELEEEAIFQSTLKRWDMMLHHLTIKPTLRKKPCG